jgi:DNA-binding IscR family transcriptional regulator
VAKKSRRGGRRPGAGAPKGNFNGLKHGRRSRQMADFAAYLARNPKISAIIANHARRQGIQEQRTEKLASHLLANILIQGIRVGKEDEARLYRTIADMME